MGLVQADGITLRRGTNRIADPEIAKIASVGDQEFVLETQDFGPTGDDVFLNFELGGRPYFFTAGVLLEAGERRLVLGFPAVVYEAERRDRARRPGGESWRRVELHANDSGASSVEVHDESSGGLAILAPEAVRLSRGDSVTLRAGDRGVQYAEVRYVEPVGEGRVRLGLAIHPRQRQSLVAVERRDDISSVGWRVAAREGVAVATFGARAAARRFVRRAFRGKSWSAETDIVNYENASGENIRAIVDSTGETRGAPVVVIPPAWGKTKETLLPLALTIVETFRGAGLPVSVLRFDGIRKRGESHNDPGCESPGRENLHYTFSQGARDIIATVDFLERSRRFASRRAILVTFSVTSIEARHALAVETKGRICGWISVMGALDPQSLIRVISGGVDFVGGVERGVNFGLQDVQGMLLDIDRAGQDALDSGVGFLDDARREMAAIDVPVTWIHGRHDAWMDLARVRDALSFGDTRNRRIVEVPTGHQLKTSREALRVFQLIAGEAGRLATGEELSTAPPNLAEIDRRRESERSRLRHARVDVRGFWRDYLIGRDGKLGMELVTHTSQYEDFMSMQIRALELRGGETVADLGSGIGSFPYRLSETNVLPPKLEILEVDYVTEALKRARAQISSRSRTGLFTERYVAAAIGSGRAGLPLRPGSADAVLASLLINYVDEPRILLDQIRLLLRPGGRLVLSGLKRDADVSGICVGGVAELRAGRGRKVFGRAEGLVSRSLPSFISDAARLLDLEERGVFRFWDAEELAELVDLAGFAEIEVAQAYGLPPQATILVARSPI